ncbi:MAG: IreB family regulatory phosphoprotein [Clostridiaceae bacterium]|nr:IreB family regulatory phosphoprotein [Clostridiaceae bacterium]
MVDKETMMFKMEKSNADQAREILTTIYQALKERGYNPINQIVGYILSGDPTYITNHKNARNMVRKLERDELLEEILKYYLESGRQEEKK